MPVVPFATAADGTRIHYSVYGPNDGEPLLMVQGLGTDSVGWIFQRRALGNRYRCIVFDNRGVGKSDQPHGPYDLEVMALDAVAVLDAAGYESAHVMGASMGGIIAQILAVRHPHRVRSAVLACTAARHHQWRIDLLQEWRQAAHEYGMGLLMHKASRWMVGPRSMRRFGPFISLLGPLALNVKPHAFIAQIDAILAMDDSMRDELVEIDVPVAVLVGSQDILTPRGDAEEIADLIPGAELVVVRGAAHAFMAEHARTFNRTVLEFLDRVSGNAVADDVSAAA